MQQQRDSLDRVGQFTDIAGPRIGAASAQHPEKGGSLVGRALGHHPVVNGTGDLQIIVTPLPQRRHQHAEDVQPVIKVTAEPALFHEMEQIPVGRADDPNIHRDHRVIAHTAHFFFL